MHDSSRPHNDKGKKKLVNQNSWPSVNGPFLMTYRRYRIVCVIIHLFQFGVLRTHMDILCPAVGLPSVCQAVAGASAAAGGEWP